MCLIRGGLLFGGILVLLSLISVEAGMLMGKGLGKSINISINTKLIKGNKSIDYFVSD